MDRRRIRGLNAGAGGSAALAEGGQIEQWIYTSWKSPKRKSRCQLQKSSDVAGGAAVGVRAAKSSEFREREQ